MKKILLLGMMALIPGVAQAALDASETNDIDVLRHQGYSESMLKVIDSTVYKNKGLYTDYRPHFVPKSQTKLGQVYINIKNYVDPIQDDMIFGSHQVNFTNTWNSDETHYSQKTVPVQVENL